MERLLPRTARPHWMGNLRPLLLVGALTLLRTTTDLAFAGPVTVTGGNKAVAQPVSPQPASPAGTGYLRTTAALAAVVALIILLTWGYRAVAGHGGRLALLLRGRHAGLIEVVSRLALSPRQSLCLVRIGPRLILLGLAPGGVQALDVIQDPDLVAQLLGQAAQRRGDSHTAEFARCLEHYAKGPQPEPEGPDESVTPEQQQLAGVKELLADTLRRLRARAVEA